MREEITIQSNIILTLEKREEKFPDSQTGKHIFAHYYYYLYHTRKYAKLKTNECYVQRLIKEC